MTLRGTLHKRGKLIDSRITSGRTIVGTSRRQGYQRKRGALIPLAHLLLNGPHEVRDIDGTLVPPPPGKARRRPSFLGLPLPHRTYVGTVVPGAKGKFEWEIRARNGNLVYSSHNQGYNRAGRVKPDGTVAKGTALTSLVGVCHGGPHDIDDTVHPAG